MDKKRKTNFRAMTNSTVAGIDLGDSASLATIISPVGDVADRFEFDMNDSGYLLFQSRVPQEARIAFEATTMAYPFSRKLVELGYADITVAHPKDLMWIAKSKKKNDRVDSFKIAKLHQAGMLPESHLLDRQVQIARDLLIQRVNLGLEVKANLSFGANLLVHLVQRYFALRCVFSFCPLTSQHGISCRTWSKEKRSEGTKHSQDKGA